MTPVELVLASASLSRQKILQAAGIPFFAEAAGVDEESVKLSLKAEGATAIEVAETLAELKALKISRKYGDKLVLGADQMLEAGGEWYDKPTDRESARRHLQNLRGKEHFLPTAVVILLNGQRIWHHRETPRLVMREFSPEFLDNYLEQVGEAAYLSVGAYQLEGLGAQLFTQIEGDFFTILGLPLLPLMSFLRERGSLVA